MSYKKMLRGTGILIIIYILLLISDARADQLATDNNGPMEKQIEQEPSTETEQSLWTGRLRIKVGVSCLMSNELEKWHKQQGDTYLEYIKETDSGRDTYSRSDYSNNAGWSFKGEAYFFSYGNFLAGVGGEYMYASYESEYLAWEDDAVWIMFYPFDYRKYYTLKTDIKIYDLYATFNYKFFSLPMNNAKFYLLAGGSIGKYWAYIENSVDLVPGSIKREDLENDYEASTIGYSFYLEAGLEYTHVNFFAGLQYSYINFKEFTSRNNNQTMKFSDGKKVDADLSYLEFQVGAGLKLF